MDHIFPGSLQVRFIGYGETEPVAYCWVEWPHGWEIEEQWIAGPDYIPF